LFHANEPAHGFFVVQSGSVSVQRFMPDGREQVIAVFRSGDSFAEVVLAGMASYPVDAVALESSQVLLVRRDMFRALVARNPDLALRMLGAMSHHLRFLVEKMEAGKSTQLENRLAVWVLNELGRCPASDGEFTLAVSKRVLASQLGVASETLSRAFARLRGDGLLIVNGRKISVPDPGRLRRLAMGAE
jgi:CRP/FNR family transcriptional regulator